jgi:hypothetical protein
MIHTKTKILAGLFVALLGVNSMGSDPMIVEKLPEIVGVSKDSIVRFELTQLGQKIQFVRKNGVWMITAPFEAKADQARVKALLLQLRKSISMDVLLERGEEDTYGLDASHSIVLEVWREEEEQPIISFALGYDGVPGSTYVRLSNDDAVYRARIGGRHRFDFPHSEWKNQLIFDFQEPELMQLDIKSDSLQYSLKRESGVWTMEPNLGWPIDIEKTQKTITRVGALRIGRVQVEPLSQKDLSLDFQFTTRETLSVNIALTEYAQIEMGTERYQSSISILAPLAKDIEYLRDKYILRFNSRTELDSITYRADDQEIILQQDLSNGFWRVLRPSGMNIDLKSVFYMVNSLSEAQALSFVTHEDGWSGDTKLVLRMLNGTSRVLEIGHRTDKGITAQIGSVQFLLNPKLVEKIQRAFGQGME